MINVRNNGEKNRGAFTLIELLVVIAIIAILAGMLFPATAFINKRKIVKKVQAELVQVQTAIELYKEKYNSYPPDNPSQPALNPLFYELSGTTLASGTYRTPDGSETIAAASLPTVFGSGVQGFVNTTRSSADDAAAAKSFLKGLPPGQTVQGVCGGVTARLLTCSVQWSKDLPPVVAAFTPTDATVKPNPWRYKSSGSLHNADGFDLWVDVIIAGKTNRISNWNKNPEIVAQP